MLKLKMMLITSATFTFYTFVFYALIILFRTYSNKWIYIILVCYLLFILFALIILSSRRRHETKTIWIVMIFMIPFFGALSYLLFGRKFAYREKLVPKKFKKKQFLAKSNWQSYNELITSKKIDPYKERIFNFITSLTKIPLQSISDFEILENGSISYDAIFKVLNNAKKYVYISAYIVSDGIVFNALFLKFQELIAKKIDIYLLYDAIGSYIDISAHNLYKLKKIGVKVSKFDLKPNFVSGTTINYRYHRKIFLIDGKIAFIGGINIGNEYPSLSSKYGYWEDYFIKFTGNAVAELEKIYVDDWKRLSNKKIVNHKIEKSLSKSNNYLALIPTGPINENSKILEILITIINTAQKEVLIATPYLVCPDELIHALQMAAIRGVNVKIITPSLPDKKIVWQATRLAYKNLIPYGVKIYETNNTFMHSKIIIIDDEFTLSGSLNFDNRSFFQNFELMGLFYSKAINIQMREKYENILQNSILFEKDKLGAIEVTFFKNMLIKIFSPLY